MIYSKHAIAEWELLISSDGDEFKAISKNGQTITEIIDKLDIFAYHTIFEDAFTRNGEDWDPLYTRNQEKDKQVLSYSIAATTRYVYRPKDTVCILLLSVGYLGPVRVSIQQNHSKVFTTEQYMGADGMGVVEYKPPFNGIYEVETEFGDVKKICRFVVAPFNFSPLEIKADSRKKGENELQADITIFRLGNPYNGEATIQILSGNSVVSKYQSTIQDGKTEVSFDMSNHSGPFSIIATLADGQSSNVLLKGTSIPDRTLSVLSAFHTKRVVSLMKSDSSISVRGLEVEDAEETDVPFDILKSVDREARIHFRKDFWRVFIAISSPLENDKTHILREVDVKAGDILSFPAFPPISNVDCLAITRTNPDRNLLSEETDIIHESEEFLNSLLGEIKAYHGSSYLLVPEELKTSITAPSQVCTGEKIEIKLQGNHPRGESVSVYLEVRDAQLDGPNVLIELSRELKEWIDTNAPDSFEYSTFIDCETATILEELKRFDKWHAEFWKASNEQLRIQNEGTVSSLMVALLQQTWFGLLTTTAPYTCSIITEITSFLGKTMKRDNVTGLISIDSQTLILVRKLMLKLDVFHKTLKSLRNSIEKREKKIIELIQDKIFSKSENSDKTKKSFSRNIEILREHTAEFYEPVNETVEALKSLQEILITSESSTSEIHPAEKEFIELSFIKKRLEEIQKRLRLEKFAFHDSDFKELLVDAYEINEAGYSRRVQVPFSDLSREQVSSVYCILGRSESRIFVWQGITANDRNHQMGIKYARKLRLKEGFHYQIETVHQGKEPFSFWQSIRSPRHKKHYQFGSITLGFLKKRKPIDEEPIKIYGNIIEKFVDLCDGTRPFEEIASKLNLSIEPLRYVALKLVEQGVLEPMSIPILSVKTQHLNLSKGLPCPCLRYGEGGDVCVNADRHINVSIPALDRDIVTNPINFEQFLVKDGNACYNSVYVDYSQDRIYCVSQGWLLSKDGQEISGRELERALKFGDSQSSFQGIDSVAGDVELSNEMIYNFILQLREHEPIREKSAIRHVRTIVPQAILPRKPYSRSTREPEPEPTPESVAEPAPEPSRWAAVSDLQDDDMLETRFDEERKHIKEGITDLGFDYMRGYIVDPEYQERVRELDAQYEQLKYKDALRKLEVERDGHRILQSRKWIREDGSYVPFSEMRQEHGTVYSEFIPEIPTHGIVKAIKIGEQIARWKILAVFKSESDIVVEERFVTATAEEYIEPDFPSVMAEGEMVDSKIFYKTKQPAKIRVTKDDLVIYSNDVFPENDFVSICIQEPGTYQTSLVVHGEIVDSRQTKIENPEIERIRYKSFSFVKSGYVVPEGTKVILLDSLLKVGEQISKSLISYPHGCAEQTSAKMFGLAAADEFSEQTGSLTNKTKELIDAGFENLTHFFDRRNGLFSMWKGGKGSVSTTVNVLRNLSILKERGVLYNSIIGNTVNEVLGTLMERGHRDPSLATYHRIFNDLPLEQAVRNPIVASQCLSAGIYSHNTTEYLRENASPSEELGYTWKYDSIPRDHFGGDQELSIIASRALLDAGHPEYSQAISRAILKKIKDGRFHSTTTTVQFLRLLSTMIKENKSDLSSYSEKHGEDAPYIIGPAVLEHPTWIMFEYENVIPIAPGGRLTIDQEVNKNSVEMGEIISISVTLEDKPICPVCRIILPPTMIFPEGGVNLQTKIIPFIDNKPISLQALGVRRGSGKIRITVLDLYDEALTTNLPPIEMNIK